MTVTVRDHVGGYIEENRDGSTTATRRFLVTGLTTSRSHRLSSVLEAGSIPRMDGRHPAMRQLRVTSRRVEPYQSNPDQALVVVTYSSRDSTGRENDESVTWTTEFVTETTIYDYLGQKMIVSYSAATAAAGGTFSTTVTTNVARVEVERVVWSARVSRRLRRTARTFNETYANRINAVPWSGYAPGLVRCRGFTSSPASEAGLHDVEGLFSIAPDDGIGWGVDAVTEVESTIPDDAREGNGVKRYQLYASADLNGSGFRVPER